MCYRGILSLLILLFALAASTNYSQGWGRADFGSPCINRLYWSVEDDNVEVVKEYLKNGWPLEKRAGLLKTTIFFHAASVGAVRTVRFLIGKGADVNSAIKGRITPIMFSVPMPGVDERYNRKKLEVFKVLLHNPKVDLKARNSGGKSVLDIAVIFGQKEIASMIREEFSKRRF